MTKYQKSLWDCLNSARKDVLISSLDNVNLFQIVKDNDYLPYLKKLYKNKNRYSTNIINQLEYYFKQEGLYKCHYGWCSTHFDYDIYKVNINLRPKDTGILCPMCRQPITTL